MLRTSLLISLVLLTYKVFPQKSMVVYFDKAGGQTSKKDCFYYTVHKKKYDRVDSIVSYYCKSDILHSIIQVDEKGEWHGTSKAFFESGKQRLKARFDHSQLVDTLTEWYPDGKMFYQRYIGTVDQPVDEVINYWEASGLQLVKDGEGFCRCAWPSRQVIETGRIKNGLKDSLWITTTMTSNIVTQEWFSEGRVVSPPPSDSVTGEGSLFSVVEESARPVGGMGSFYHFIAMNIRYPASAKRLNIQGKVFVEFVIETDGRITNAGVVKGIGGGCDEEAVRVVSISPNWIPGQQEGKPVRQKMVLPISFKLGGSIKQK